VVKPPKSEAILRDILAALTDMKQKVVELHEWHNVSDNEGMKVWYERHALIKQLVGLATDIKSAVATVLGKIELIGQKINSKK
jgi:hypothetical protein